MSNKPFDVIGIAESTLRAKPSAPYDLYRSEPVKTWIVALATKKAEDKRLTWDDIADIVNLGVETEGLSPIPVTIDGQSLRQFVYHSTSMAETARELRAKAGR